MIPKSGDRFSEQIMRKTERMIPKGVKRLSDQIMRKMKRMIRKRVAPQTREA
jgi:hypothetical protein